jgi:hypothetical protein
MPAYAAGAVMGNYGRHYVNAGVEILNESLRILKIARLMVIPRLRNPKVQQQLPLLIGEAIRSGGRD